MISYFSEIVIEEIIIENILIHVLKILC